MYRFLGLFAVGVAIVAASTYKSEAEVEAQIDRHMAEREMVVYKCVQDYKKIYTNSHYMNVADICDMVADGEGVL